MADLDRQKVRDAARDLQNDFQKAGDASGRALSQGITSKMPEVERALDRATAASGRFLVEQQKLETLMSKSGDNRDKIIAQSERVATAYRKESSALREVETALSAASATASGATESLAEVGSTVGNLGRLAAPAMFAAMAAGLVELTSVASAASGAVGLLPGAVTAAASAFGTLKLATMGFGDAVKDMGDPKKFAEDLKQLSPNAQQAALSIQQLMPAFLQLKNATQDALFAGVGPQLQQLTSSLMPTIKAATTMIAGNMNQMFMQATGTLMSPEVHANLLATAQNIGNTFKSLVPAIAPLTTAFAEIGRVSTSFMPQLAGAASQAATSFANFISEASKSGQLQQWISEGISVLRQMMSIVGQLGGAFLAMAPEGQRAMNEIKTAVDAVAVSIRLLSGDVSALGDVFPTFGEVAVNIFNRINSAIDTAMNPLRAMIDAANHLPGINIPQIPHLQQATTPGLSGGPMGGAGLGVSSGQVAYPSGDPNRPMQWVAGQGWTPAFGSGNLPVPMGTTPGIGSGLLGGSASARGQGTTWGNPPPKGAAGSTALPQAPALPYDSSLPPGFENVPQTGEILSAENAWMDARHNLAEKQARVQQLEQNNNATADDIQKAKNDVVQAQQQQQQSELRLYDARNQLYEKNNKQLNSYANQMGEIGAKLDQDLGISKGLPGIADNLVRFLGNLIAAPELVKLNAIANAPGQAQGGYGLMGVLGAQGVFGPQYTYAGQQAGQNSSSSGAGSAVLQPGGGVGFMPGRGGAGSPLPGESARDFAHRVMMPFWQSQGFQVGDHAADKYGEHQNGALDIMVPSIQAGQGVLQQVLSDPNVYGAIFNNQTYGYGHGLTPQDYTAGHTGDPSQDHTNHVHAWYKPGDPNDIMPGAGGAGAMPGGYQSMGSPFGSVPIPLPVTIVGAGAGGGGAVPVTLPGMPGGGASLWDKVAQAESGGQWDNRDTGHNGHFGGLQFSPSTWTAFGGTGNPADATREQQIDIANRTAFTGYNGTPPQGLGAWETITNGSVPGVTTNTPASAFGVGGWAGPGLPTQAPSGQGWGGGVNGPMVGGAAGGPGLGPTQIGGVDPLQGRGSGGIGMTEGGSLDTAIGLAASAFPGVGQAAQTGIKLANRAIQYGGQVAGIMTQGALDTFLPFGGSQLAQNSWLTRIVGGLAGAVPALPNVAGKSSQQQQQPPGAPASGQGQGPPPGPGVTNNVTVNNNRQTEDGTGKDLTRHLNAMYAPAAMP